MAWPLLALRRPWVIAHHTWAPRSGAGAFAGLLKHAATRFAKNIAVSEAMARSLNVPAVIIPNPYDESLFVARPCEHRDKDIVFLGRLVSDKGVAVLIEALSRLRRRGHERRLTVIGTGPEEKALRAQVGALKLDTCVEFLGVRRGAELVTLLCQHRILVVPSVWEEPFGVVVLEAIACGLVPIVAQSGGLPDAVGRCGIIVPKSDSAALADAIDSLAGDELRMAQFRAAAPLHLAQHTRNRIAAAYLQVLETTVRRDTQSPAC
jgi:glycosyltransferase involved in cell wall biosynthesis